MKVKIPEKTIEKQIIQYLRSRRIFCTKIDNTGIYDAKIGRFRMQHGTFKLHGISDIYAMYKGHAIWIEVKAQGGKLSEHQKEFLESVKREGAIAIVARSVDDVETALNNITDDIHLATEGPLEKRG